MSLIDINIHSNDTKLAELASAMSQIVSLISKIGDTMTTQTDIDLLTTQVTKVMHEVVTAKQVLLDRIAELQALIDAGQPVDLTALMAAVQGLDDINPDVV